MRRLLFAIDLVLVHEYHYWTSSPAMSEYAAKTGAPARPGGRTVLGPICVRNLAEAIRYRSAGCKSQAVIGPYSLDRSRP